MDKFSKISIIKYKIEKKSIYFFMVIIKDG